MCSICGRKWEPLDLHRPSRLVEPERRSLLRKIENHLMRKHTKQQLVERIIIEVGDSQQKRYLRFGIVTKITRCPVGYCKKEWPIKEKDFNPWVLGEKEPLANHLTKEHTKRQLAQRLIQYFRLKTSWISS